MQYRNPKHIVPRIVPYILQLKGLGYMKYTPTFQHFVECTYKGHILLIIMKHHLCFLLNQLRKENVSKSPDALLNVTILKQQYMYTT